MCIHVHVTMACGTIVCNTTDTAVLSKKFRLHGESEYVDKSCMVVELRSMVGSLQSTVGGLCAVQYEKKGEEEDKMLGEKLWGCAEDTF